MMHPVSVDARPPSSNLVSSDSANASEPPEDADPKAKPAGRGEKAGLEGMEDGLALGNILAARVEQEKDLRDAEYLSQGDTQVDQCRYQPGPRPAKPFQKWMKTLHKRVLRQQEMLGYDGSLPPWLHGTRDGDSQPPGSAHHRHSSSDSSFAFVTAAKSASISMTGVSLLTRSRKTTIRSSRGPRTERSSRASISGPRVSEDSCCPERQAPVDPAVVERALQRRRILEELISTEEGYIGDVRFLMNVGLGLRDSC
jgi:hypothetical protein